MSTLGAKTVILAALSLVVLASMAWLLGTQTTRDIDGDAQLRAWFELGELPVGVRIAEAHELPRGDLVVRLERTEAGEEPPRVEAPEEPESKMFEPYDWSQVSSSPSGSAPREVLIVGLPLDRARSELRELFDGGTDLRGDWTSVPRSGGRRVLERGRLDWGTLAAPFVLEREFESGGTYCDTLRVNLTIERDPRIVIARWTRGAPGSREPVQALLRGLAPRKTDSVVE